MVVAPHPHGEGQRHAPTQCLSHHCTSVGYSGTFLLLAHHCGLDSAGIIVVGEKKNIGLFLVDDGQRRPLAAPPSIHCQGHTANVSSVV